MPPPSAARLPASPSASAAAGSFDSSPSEALRRTPRATWESDEGEAEDERAWALGPAANRNLSATSRPSAAGAADAAASISGAAGAAGSSPRLSPNGHSGSAGGSPALGHARYQPQPHRTHSHRLRTSAPAPSSAPMSASPSASGSPRTSQQPRSQHTNPLHHSISALVRSRGGSPRAGAEGGGGSPLHSLRPHSSRVHPISPASMATSLAGASTTVPLPSGASISGAAGAVVPPRQATAPSSPFLTAAPAAAGLAASPTSVLYGRPLTAAPPPLARSSSPGGYQHAIWPGGSQPPNHHHHHHHSASVGGAALPATLSRSVDLGNAPAAAAPSVLPLPTRLPPLLVTPAAASMTPTTSSRASRITADDVEVATQDQAATGGTSAGGAALPSTSYTAGGAGGADAASGGGATAKQRHRLGGPSRAALQPADSAADGAAAAAAVEQVAPSSPAAAAAAAGDAVVVAPAAPVSPPVSRLQLSVTVIGGPPATAVEPAAATTDAVQRSGGGAAGVGQAGDAAATPPGEVPAAVGVPVLLLPPAMSAGGVLSHVTVVGRPAAAQAVTGGAGSGGGAAAPEPGVDGIDAVATIAVAGTGGTARRRPRTSSGVSGGGDGEESGVDEEGSGPCVLPAEVRRRLRTALGRQRMKNVRTWKDLSYSMASPRPGYWLLATLLLSGMLLGAFAFMAGQYEFLRAGGGAGGGAWSGSVATSLPPPSRYLSALAPPSPSPPPPSPSPPAASPACWGPRCLAGWLAFWRVRSARTFSFDYLRAWGGRYGPDLAAGQWWRWLSSLLLHASPLHLASNLALLLVLCSYLESLYGCWRVLPVWLLAGVAGNMASAFFEAPCTLVVGSSGAVFGLLGAYAADAGINWESLPLLWLRLGGMAGLGGAMLALQLTNHGGAGGGSGSVSNASHAGGFLVGLLAAGLITPDFKARRCDKVKRLLTGLGLESSLPPPASPAGRQLYSFWQRHRYAVYGLYGGAVAVLLLALVAVPLHLYLRTFKGISCD